MAFRRRCKEYFHFLKSLVRTNFYLVWGMWRLTKVPQPAITIFGGSHVSLAHPLYQEARKLAKMLAAHGFSIITGGGQGIMHAANQGAIDYLKENNLEEYLSGKIIKSAGVGLISFVKEVRNPFVQEHIDMTHFFARKWLLVRYSVGFIIFPGGFGTIDELFEIITLIQCNQMVKVPIILIDVQHWKPMIQWIEMNLLQEGLVTHEDVKIVTLTDSIEEAFDIIKQRCTHTNQSLLRNEFIQNKR